MVDGQGGIYLDVQGERFECRRVNVSWHMMKFAKAQRDANVFIPKNMPEGPQRTELEDKRNRAGMSMMATMLDVVMVLLKPHERPRFESFMDSADDIPMGALENAIGAVIAKLGGDDEGKADASSPSSASPETTSPSSPVTSSRPVTVEDALPAWS